jgi:hypothetical protein
VYDTFMTIVVDPVGSEREYQVHRGLLCYHSKYFDRLLNGGFKEAGSKMVSLVDVDVDVFRTFYYWLNSGLVDCSDINIALSEKAKWTAMLKVYAFTDFY